MTQIGNFIKRLRDIMWKDAGVNGDAQRIEQIAWMLFLKVYDIKEENWEWADSAYTSILPAPCRWRNWAHHESGKGMTGDDLLDFVNNVLFPVLRGTDVELKKDLKITEDVALVKDETIRGVLVTPDTPIAKAVVRSVFQDANNYMKDGVLLRQAIDVIDAVNLEDYEDIHAFGEMYESLLREIQSAGAAGEFYTPRAVTEFMAQKIRPKIGETMADFACGTGGFLTSWLAELRKEIKTTADQEAWGDSIRGIEKKQFPYLLCITNLLLHGIDTPRVFHQNSLTENVLDFTEKDRVDVILMNPPYGGSETESIKHHFPTDLASSETADLFMALILYRLKKDGRAAVVLPDGFLFGADGAKIAIKKKLLAEYNLHTVIRLPASVFAPYTSITTNILFFDRTGATEKTWYYRLDMPDGMKHFSKTKPMRREHLAPVDAWWDDRKEIQEGGWDKAKCYTAAELAERNYNLDLCGYPHEEEEILPPDDLIRRYKENRAAADARLDAILAEIENLLKG